MAHPGTTPAACPPEAAALRVASLGDASSRTSSGTAPESAILTCKRGQSGGQAEEAGEPACCGPRQAAGRGATTVAAVVTQIYCQATVACLWQPNSKQQPSSCLSAAQQRRQRTLLLLVCPADRFLMARAEAWPALSLPQRSRSVKPATTLSRRPGSLLQGGQGQAEWRLWVGAGAGGEDAVPAGQAGRRCFDKTGRQAGLHADRPTHPSWVRTSAQQARLLSVQAAASRQVAPQPPAGSSRSDSTASAPSFTICFCVCSQLHAMLLQQAVKQWRVAGRRALAGKHHGTAGNLSRQPALQNQHTLRRYGRLCTQSSCQPASQPASQPAGQPARPALHPPERAGGCLAGCLILPFCHEPHQQRDGASLGGLKLVLGVPPRCRWKEQAGSRPRHVWWCQGQ